MLKWIFKRLMSQVLVAHTCKYSCSRGRDQEDPGSNPGQANSSRDPVWKISNTKQGWQVVQVLEHLPATMSLLYISVLYFVIWCKLE
jgi:hypothetical protein